MTQNTARVAKQSQSAPDQSLAIAAESLYLANLLLLPGVAFCVLLWLYLRNRTAAGELASLHLRQTLSASIWAGVILVVVNGGIVLTGGYQSPNTWVIVIIYFTICHTTLVLLGILGLAKAMAGMVFRYPLIGGLPL